jgi:diadenosine tetraphosphatase ApaH/serine/threonine PP2A family protein phosphatase
MLIGAFSDVHSNLEALRTVLDFFRSQGVQRPLCGGDIVGYGPDPQACIQLVRNCGARVVAGNHDRAVAGSTGISDFNHFAAQAVNWTRKQLSGDEIGFLARLPLTFDFGPIQLVHAAPSNPARWEYILTLEDAVAEFGAFVTDICLIGHSHIPMAVEKISGQRAQLVTANPFPLRPDARYLISLGSVGQPRDGDPRACCVIIDLNQRQVAFHRLPYDYRRTQQKIIAAGLPEYLALRLETGA